MKKVLLAFGILLFIFSAEAQNKGCKQKLENCSAEFIPETNSKGKFYYSSEFESAYLKEDTYYLIKSRIERKSRIKEFIEVDEENKNLIIYKGKIYGILGNNDEIEKTYKARITFKDNFYKVEISDITFAKVLVKKNKRKLHKKKTLESLLKEKNPDCEIIKDLDLSVPLLFKLHTIFVSDITQRIH